MKKCSKCAEEKPLDSYSKNKRTPDGLQQHCKACNAGYYKANAAAVLARVAAAYQADPSKTKKRAADWYKQNTDRAKENAKAWGAKNRGLKAAYNAAWIARNPEKAREMRRRTHAANPDASKSRTRTYRARKRGADGTHTASDIKYLLVLQLGKCAVCKVKVGANYHVDHIVPLALGGANSRINLQILCQSCNTSKGAKHPVDFMRKRGYLI